MIHHQRKHPKHGRESVFEMRGLMRMLYVEIHTPLTVA